MLNTHGPPNTYFCAVVDLWAAARHHRSRKECLGRLRHVRSFARQPDIAEMQSSPLCDIRELADFRAASSNRRNERALLCDICNLCDLRVAPPCGGGI